MTPDVRALILAAGSSTRFGKQKLRENLPSGNTVLEQTLNRVKLAVPDVKVVTSIHFYETLQTQGREFEIFSGASSGMGATLSYGIRLTEEADACLVCLADMPFIQTTTYQTLAALLTSENIVVPIFEGKKGNPVGFGKRFFNDLMLLNGDIGGRELLRRYSDVTQHVKVEDPAILYDIDTPADLEKYVAAHS